MTRFFYISLQSTTLSTILLRMVWDGMGWDESFYTCSAANDRKFNVSLPCAHYVSLRFFFAVSLLPVWQQFSSTGWGRRGIESPRPAGGVTIAKCL